MVLSKITKAVATKITSGIDNLDVAMFGGELAKAEFNVYKKDDLKDKIKTIKFFLNPHTVQISKEAQLKEEQVPGSTTTKKFSLTYPICLKLGEIWFDTYDTRTSVRTEYINDIESLLDYLPETHYPPVVVFNWGNWFATGKTPMEYKFFVTKCTVDYTLFMPDATPVRAKVDLTLEQISPQKEQGEVRPKRSPDHAKLYTVKKGDTLQAIAMAEYDNPKEWRRIAKTNNLNDPMDLRPGMKLLVPPILK